MLSYYERSSYAHKCTSLLQYAAFYNSVKIFNFLVKGMLNNPCLIDFIIKAYKAAIYGGSIQIIIQIELEYYAIIYNQNQNIIKFIKSAIKSFQNEIFSKLLNKFQGRIFTIFPYNTLVRKKNLGALLLLFNSVFEKGRNQKETMIMLLFKAAVENNWILLIMLILSLSDFDFAYFCKTSLLQGLLKKGYENVFDLIIRNKKFPKNNKTISLINHYEQKYGLKSKKEIMGKYDFEIGLNTKASYFENQIVKLNFYEYYHDIIITMRKAFNRQQFKHWAILLKIIGNKPINFHLTYQLQSRDINEDNVMLMKYEFNEILKRYSIPNRLYIYSGILQILIGINNQITIYSKISKFSKFISICDSYNLINAKHMVVCEVAKKKASDLKQPKINECDYRWGTLKKVIKDVKY